MRISPAVAATVGFVLLTAGTARADSYIDGMIFGVGVGVPVGVLATSGAIVGARSDADGGRPSTGAMTFAITTGSLSVAWGSLLLYQSTRVSDNKVLQVAPGVFDVAAGLTAVVWTLVRNSRPRTAPSATLLPVVGRGAGGELVPTLRFVFST